jgi:hypothetical protein
LLVSGCGVLGLALSLLYVLAVVASFDPRGAEISRVMVGSHSGEFGWALPLAAIPYTLLVAHLFMRTRFAHWLLRRGAAAEALAYTEDKLEAGFMRSKLEATSHRSATVAACVQLGNDSQAKEIARRLPDASSRNALNLEGAYWRALVALRNDDLVEAKDALDGLKRRRRQIVGDLLALRAEVFARESKREEWERDLEHARWAGATAFRLAWAEAVGVERFRLVGRAEGVLVRLQKHSADMDREVPGREFERYLVSTQIGELINSAPTSGDFAAEAQNMRHLDGRSKWLLETATSESAGDS